MPAESPLRDGEPAGLELIETMRWEPDAGLVRLDRHMARLSASAAELGFAHAPPKIDEALANAVAGKRTMLRIRLTLSRAGDVNVSAQPFEPLAADTVWKLRIARVRLNSTDPLLRHKTSRRQIYAQARAEYSVEQADEVLLANERGELCEGTITNLFADFGDGILRTPSLECGLLPGVLRGELLDGNRAREELISTERLGSAKALLVGNSLRGLIAATLGSH